MLSVVMMVVVLVEVMMALKMAMLGIGDRGDDNGCSGDGDGGFLVVVSVWIELLLEVITALLVVVGCW